MSGKKGAQGNHSSTPAVPDQKMSPNHQGASSALRAAAKNQTNARRRRRDRTIIEGDPTA